MNATDAANRGWYINLAARSSQVTAPDVTIREFHRSWPAYAPTPLREVSSLAERLEVGAVFVKQESQRFGLPAFKILGASYAIARALAARLKLDEADLTVEALRARLADSTACSLVAATDGNHGRAVARVAHLLGIAATVYVPVAISQAAKTAIVGEGANLIELDAPYDEVVRQAAAAAAAEPTAVLIQDTAWAGYEEVPHWIVAGYDTMLAEVDEQVRAAGYNQIDLVVVPVGVGSLAQSVVTHYRSTQHRPAVLVVEPTAAASVAAALHQGVITTIETIDTAMTGLNCGTVSSLAWPVLRDGLDAATAVSDREALAAVAELAELDVDAGPCGAASLAGAYQVLRDPTRRAALQLATDAVVILLSTEGRAANPPSTERTGEQQRR